MSQPRASLWATEEIDEDLQVDVQLAIGNYGQNGLYEDGPYIHSVIVSPPSSFPCAAAQPRIDEATLVAVQHQMAQQAAFAQIPDPVKRVRIGWRKSNGTAQSIFS
jgi:translation initiation factor 3 subunit L